MNKTISTYDYNLDVSDKLQPRTSSDVFLFYEKLSLLVVLLHWFDLNSEKPDLGTVWFWVIFWGRDMVKTTKVVESVPFKSPHSFGNAFINQELFYTKHLNIFYKKKSDVINKKTWWKWSDQNEWSNKSQGLSDVAWRVPNILPRYIIQLICKLLYEQPKTKLLSVYSYDYGYGCC